jgi:hypothetical protein
MRHERFHGRRSRQPSRFVLVRGDARLARKIAASLRCDRIEVINESRIEHLQAYLRRLWRRPEAIITGLQGLAYLRSLEFLEWDLPIVVTGDGEDDAAKESATRMGAAAFLDPSLEPGILGTVLRPLFNRRSLARHVWERA